MTRVPLLIPLAVATALSASVGAQAQRQFQQDANRLPQAIGTGQSSMSELAAGDLNGDGRLDFFANGNPVAVFAQQPSGSFVFAAQNVVVSSDEIVRLLDADGDGDLDAFLMPPATGARNVKLLINDGTGTFARVTTSGPLAPIVASAAVGDLDGDNLPDLVLAHGSGSGTPQIQVWINQGASNFSLLTAAIPGLTAVQYFVALADLDGDNDLFVVNNGGFLAPSFGQRLLENTRIP